MEICSLKFNGDKRGWLIKEGLYNEDGLYIYRIWHCHVSSHKSINRWHDRCL